MISDPTPVNKTASILSSENNRKAPTEHPVAGIPPQIKVVSTEQLLCYLFV
jgi:hypothetical protein